MDPRILDALQRSGRFEIRRRLGAGGAGTVFEARDRERDADVALKVLHHLSSRAIYAFKREFRALADVDHPNLIRLHELLFEHEAWFLTMELLRGRDFAEAVRHPDAPPLDEPGSHATTRLETPMSRLVVDGEPSEPHPTPLLVTRFADERVLRDALRQLAEGLEALHRLGKLHRDIKPSNVLVTDEGRVVLLDFGLVSDLSLERSESLLDGVVGTPAYMAPEQAAGMAVSPASDWYGVGVMLYQALTGRLPFPGPPLAVLVDKQRRDPAPPSRLAHAIPDDLEALCVALLHRDPARRPTSAEVLAALGGVPAKPRSSERGSRPSSSSLDDRVFVGRDAQLRLIDRLARSTRRGHAAVLTILGAPGYGKTALLRRATERLRTEDERTLILGSRCHLRESMPYKAFDGVVEALARGARRMPAEEVERFLPYHVHALVRLFPLLDRVEQIADAANRRVVDVPDGQELRRRAFGAFRELLQRIAEERPVVIAIDDLHRGDEDSLALMVELLRPPDPPPVLWLLAMRGDDPGAIPVLETLASPDLEGPRLELERLELEPLLAADATSLAGRLLPDLADRAVPERIAAESEGIPFVLITLVEHARRGDLDPGASSGIEQLLQTEIAELSGDARTALEVISLVGGGISVPVLREASELGHSLPGALAELRARRIIRIRGAEIIESAHEHLGDILSTAASPERRQALHLRLARALQARGDADPHELARHYEAAGERSRAAEHAVAAAEQASSSLAFERAAAIYRLALDLSEDEPQRRALRAGLGDALAAAGRGREAAAAYLIAAEGSLAATSLELRRRAAEQLLISGHIDEGLEAIAAVLRSIGMRLAPTPRRAVLSIVLRRALLAVRGRRFRERDASQVAAETLIRIDTCWSVFVGLSIVDTVRGVDYGTRHLVLALRAGEPNRVARALAVEAGMASTAGARSQQRVEKLVREATRLARRVGSDHGTGLAALMGGMGAYLGGRFRRAREMFEDAEAIFRERCSGVTWEVDTAVQFHLRSLLYLGELATLRQRLPELLRDVRARGDLYAETNLRSRLTWFLRLLDGDLAGAERELRTAAATWSHRGFHVQHYWQITGVVECALWAGEPERALAEIRDRWAALASSLLLRVEFTRTEAWLLRARAAVAAAAAARLDSPAWHDAARDARRSLHQARRPRLEWAGPLADLAEAGLRAADGDHEVALDLLDRAEAGCRGQGLELLALVAAIRHAELVGVAAREVHREALAKLTDLGVAEVERLLDVLAPGSWKRLETHGRRNVLRRPTVVSP